MQSRFQLIQVIFFVFSLLFPRKNCSLDSRNLTLSFPLSKTVVLSSMKQKDSFPVFLKFLSENSSSLRAMQQSLLCTSEPEGHEQPFQGPTLQSAQEIYFSCTWSSVPASTTSQVSWCSSPPKLLTPLIQFSCLELKPALSLWFHWVVTELCLIYGYLHQPRFKLKRVN